VAVGIGSLGGAALTAMAHRAAEFFGVVDLEIAAGMRGEGLRLALHARILHARVASHAAVDYAELRNEILHQPQLELSSRFPAAFVGGFGFQQFTVLRPQLPPAGEHGLP